MFRDTQYNSAREQEVGDATSLVLGVIRVPDAKTTTFYFSCADSALEASTPGLRVYRGVDSGRFHG